MLNPHKSPYECDDIEELREIAFYWLQKSKTLHLQMSIFLDMLLENGINPSMQDLMNRLNEKLMKQQGEKE